MNWAEYIDTFMLLIIRVVFAGIACLASTIIIPWLKNQYIWFYIVKFVNAADKLEETGELGKGDIKKEYVIKCLKNAGIEVTDTIESWIEAAVREADITARKIKDIIKENA